MYSNKDIISTMIEIDSEHNLQRLSRIGINSIIRELTNYSCIDEEKKLYCLEYALRVRFEIKREVRRVNDDINEIKNVKKPTVYTRENGIIKKDGEDICFDTGVRELPDYDEKVGDLAYTIIETTENISDYKGQIQARKRLLKDKVIKVNSDTPDEEILRTFKGYTDFMKALNNPELDEYISKKYEELKKAIIIEKEVLPLKKKLKKAEDDNKVLEARNAGLKAELEKASKILKQIKSNRIGKIFFGKKIEDKNDENKKGLK